MDPAGLPAHHSAQRHQENLNCVSVMAYATAKVRHPDSRTKETNRQLFNSFINDQQQKFTTEDKRMGMEGMVQHSAGKGRAQHPGMYEAEKGSAQHSALRRPPQALQSPAGGKRAALQPSQNSSRIPAHRVTRVPVTSVRHKVRSGSSKHSPRHSPWGALSPAHLMAGEAVGKSPPCMLQPCAREIPQLTRENIRPERLSVPPQQMPSCCLSL